MSFTAGVPRRERNIRAGLHGRSDDQLEDRRIACSDSIALILDQREAPDRSVNRYYGIGVRLLPHVVNLKVAKSDSGRMQGLP